MSICSKYSIWPKIKCLVSSYVRVGRYRQFVFDFFFKTFLFEKIKKSLKKSKNRHKFP